MSSSSSVGWSRAGAVVLDCLVAAILASACFFSSLMSVFMKSTRASRTLSGRRSNQSTLSRSTERLSGKVASARISSKAVDGRWLARGRRDSIRSFSARSSGVGVKSSSNFSFVSS